MIFSKVILVKGKMGFGLLAAFAVRDGYSVSYYKRAHAKKLTKLGRIAGAQGKPGLRCTEEFLKRALDYGRVVRGLLGEKMDTFILDQSGVQVRGSWEPKPTEYVRFIVERGHIYSVEVSLSGMLYNIDDAPMLALGDS